MIKIQELVNEKCLLKQTFSRAVHTLSKAAMFTFSGLRHAP